MPTFSDFQKLYDFSLIEAAVAAVFVGIEGGSFVLPPDETDPNRGTWQPGGASIAFYTNRNILVNQSARPRVKIRLHNVNHRGGNYAVDANNNVREKAWQGSMDFGIVTEPNYNLHVQLRSQILAIIPMVLAQLVPDGSQFASTGINALLQYHEVSEFWSRNVSTEVAPAEGAYMSMIPVELAFNAKNSAWPAGMITF